MIPQPFILDDIDESKDYIINGKVLRDVANYAKCSWVEKVAARPAPSPSENQKTTKELRGASELYRAGLKDGAAQAREKVLDATRDEILKEMKSSDTISGAQLYTVFTRLRRIAK